MCYDDDCDCCSSSAKYDDTQAQKSYLNHRLWNVSNEKETEIRKIFGLTDDGRPTSAKELVDRITAGKYVLGDRQDDYTYDPLMFIEWRDPAVKKDPDGAAAAMKIKEEKSTDVEDIIMTGSSIDALAAIKAFQAWVPTAS